MLGKGHGGLYDASTMEEERRKLWQCSDKFHPSYPFALPTQPLFVHRNGQRRFTASTRADQFIFLWKIMCKVMPLSKKWKYEIKKLSIASLSNQYSEKMIILQSLCCRNHEQGFLVIWVSQSCQTLLEARPVPVHEPPSKAWTTRAYKESFTTIL